MILVAWKPQDSILPPEWEVVPELLAAAREARERFDNFAPILTWQAEDGTAGFTMVKHSAGGLPSAVDEVLTALEAMYGPPAWFAVTVDAYGRIADQQHEPNLRPDDLSNLFAAGDWAVVEQLMLMVARSGHVGVWRQVYRHTLVDGWEWDDPEYMLNPVLPDNGLLEILLGHSH